MLATSSPRRAGTRTSSASSSEPGVSRIDRLHALRRRHEERDGAGQSGCHHHAQGHRPVPPAQRDQREPHRRAGREDQPSAGAREGQSVPYHAHHHGHAHRRDDTPGVRREREEEGETYQQEGTQRGRGSARCHADQRRRRLQRKGPGAHRTGRPEESEKSPCHHGQSARSQVLLRGTPHSLHSATVVQRELVGQGVKGQRRTQWNQRQLLTRGHLRAREQRVVRAIGRVNADGVTACRERRAHERGAERRRAGIVEVDQRPGDAGHGEGRVARPRARFHRGEAGLRIRAVPVVVPRAAEPPEEQSRADQQRRERPCSARGDDHPRSGIVPTREPRPRRRGQRPSQGDGQEPVAQERHQRSRQRELQPRPGAPPPLRRGTRGQHRRCAERHHTRQGAGHQPATVEQELEPHIHCAVAHAPHHRFEQRARLRRHAREQKGVAQDRRRRQRDAPEAGPTRRRQRAQDGASVTRAFDACPPHCELPHQTRQRPSEDQPQRARDDETLKRSCVVGHSPVWRFLAGPSAVGLQAALRLQPAARVGIDRNEIRGTD